MHLEKWQQARFLAGSQARSTQGCVTQTYHSWWCHGHVTAQASMQKLQDAPDGPHQHSVLRARGFGKILNQLQNLQPSRLVDYHCFHVLLLYESTGWQDMHLFLPCMCNATGRSLLLSCLCISTFCHILPAVARPMAGKEPGMRVTTAYRQRQLVRCSGTKG